MPKQVVCRFGETLIPDVWFDAKTVWEVKAADLSVSPVHCAATGLVDATKGVSIRFPRLVSKTISVLHLLALRLPGSVAAAGMPLAS